MQRYKLAVAIALISSAACDSTTEPLVKPSSRGMRLPACEGPPTSIDRGRALALRSGISHTPDDDWVEWAETLPGGFAGITQSRDGTPILLLANPSHHREAKAALAPRMPHFNIRDATVLQTRWDFAQLFDWRLHLTTSLDYSSLDDGDITSSDVDETINRIAFGVRDSAAMDRVASAIKAVDLPCDLIQLEIVPPGTLLGARDTRLRR